jgi:hypothetical protein
MSINDQINDEVLAALQGEVDGLNRNEIFEHCPSATSANQISSSLNRLAVSGAVERLGGGRWSAVDDPVPEAEPQKPAAAIQAPEQAIPRFGEDSDPVIAAIRSLPTPTPFPQAERRARVLEELAAWPAMHTEVADELRAIANEIKRRTA